MDSDDMLLAAAGDLAVVEELVSSAYGHSVARIGRKLGPMLDDHAARIAAGRTHLLERNRAVLGLIVFIPQADALLVENVAISPAAQGLGLGRRLMDFAEMRARAAGLLRLRLNTHVAWSRIRRSMPGSAMPRPAASTKPGCTASIWKSFWPSRDRGSSPRRPAAAARSG